MIKVLIKKLNQKAIIPSYETSGSSGLDLTALIESEIIIPPKKSALISTGLEIPIPDDTEVQIIEQINFLNNDLLTIGSTLLIPLSKTPTAAPGASSLSRSAKTASTPG